MNVEGAITKKDGNGKGSACKVINIINKKFSTKEVPVAVVKSIFEYSLGASIG